jgi:hypothetical protein
MVRDRKAIAAGKSGGSSSHFYALKVQKSAEHYTEAAMDEVELLDCVAKERKKCEALLSNAYKDSSGISMEDEVEHSKHVASLHDSFFHTGPNGRHMCMVFSMLGCNLLSVIKAFNYRGIPIPVVKKMVRGICRGLDFLHRKCSIIHTDLKPENVLLQFPSQMAEYEDATSGVAALSIEDEEVKPTNVVQTIEQLEGALRDPKTPTEERKKIRKKLKKKRQKERRRATGQANDIDTSDEDIDEDGEASEEEKDETKQPSPRRDFLSMLSDFEMEKILNRAAQMISPNGPDYGLPAKSHNRVKQRLGHSAFVTCNFGPNQKVVDSKLMEVMESVVEVSNPTASDLRSYLETSQEKGGVAEITFLLRAFTPEEELADSVSAALGDISWEKSDDERITREW